VVHQLLMRSLERTSAGTSQDRRRCIVDWSFGC